METSIQYFLSVYMQAPDITSLTVMRHDHCAALWRLEGSHVTLQRYWEFERVTGLKHHRLPLRDGHAAREFLDGLLADEGLSLENMTAVWGTPGLQTEPRFGRAAVPEGHTVHSVCHVLGAVLLDWDLFRNETIFGMALDAGPDVQLDSRPPRTIYTGCIVERGEVTLFPVESPGALWLLARGRLGREEGTLMALATATTCQVDHDLTTSLASLPFWTQADVFTSSEFLLDEILAVVQGALSTPGGRDTCRYDDRFDESENVHSAAMKLVDQASAQIVDRNIDRARRQHGLDPTNAYLGLSGGYALNCPNNSRLIDQYGFRGLLAPPCVNDGGQALGIGLVGLYERGLPKTASFRLGHAFHGRLPGSLPEALARFGSAIERVTAFDPMVAVTDVISGPIAWVHGAAEVGPRALGHRSLLGDPRPSQTKDALNRMKLRQWWRPVAPMVLEEHVHEWFVNGRPSPFMLEVLSCRADRRHAVPSVLHLDGTARVQTISAEDDPVLHEFVRRFGDVTGVPMLCNTSLNDRGEPLVDTASEAVNFCIRKGVRVLYVDGSRIELRPDAAARVPLPGPEPRRFEPFQDDAARWRDLWLEWTRRGLTPEALFVYSWNPLVRDSVDPAGRGTVQLLERLVPLVLRRVSDRERRFINHLVRNFGPDADPMAAATSAELVGGG